MGKNGKSSVAPCGARFPPSVGSTAEMLQVSKALLMAHFAGRTLCCLASLLFAVVTTAVAHAQGSSYVASIYVREGPDGEIQVSTPWGDYAAYDEGGGYYWVGTRREFDRQRVIAIARESGSRLSTVNVSGADATFVQEGTLRARVGALDVDGLSPSIMFGAKIIDEHNRPVTDMRPVDFSWIQAEGTAPTALIVYSSHDRLRYIGHSEAAGQGWYHETLDVYKKDLVRTVALILVLPHEPPAVIGISSIAAFDYDVATKTVESEANLGVSADSGQLHHIQYLRMLDSSLATGRHAGAVRVAQATPAPTPQTSGAPHEVAATQMESSYTGSIYDQMAGHGRMSMTLFRDGTGNVTGGTWIASFSNPRFNNDGPIDGYESESQSGAVFLLKSSEGSCPYEVHATTASDGTLEATYTGISCRWQNGGNFTLRATALVTPSAQKSLSTASPIPNVATEPTPESIEPAAGATVPPANSVAIVRWTPGHRFLRTATGATVDLRTAESTGPETIYLRGMPITAGHGLLISFPNAGGYHLFNGAYAPMSVDVVTINSVGEVEGVMPLRATQGQGVSEVGMPTGAQSQNAAKFVIILRGGEAVPDGLVPGATIDGLHG